MYKECKEWLGYSICELAFKYDRKFLSHLTFDEDEWTTLDFVKWKIYDITYDIGTFFLK